MLFLANTYTSVLARDFVCNQQKPTLLKLTLGGHWETQTLNSQNNQPSPTIVLASFYLSSAKDKNKNKNKTNKKPVSA